MKSRQIALMRETEANNKYNHKFNNVKYYKATTNKDGSKKSNRYCNDLINEALAICGHPNYKLSNRNWDEVAYQFLTLFA